MAHSHVNARSMHVMLQANNSVPLNITQLAFIAANADTVNSTNRQNVSCFVSRSLLGVGSASCCAQKRELGAGGEGEV